jgi:ubiquinol-cytochrome c reductase cytochrome c1 subunit
MNILRSAAVALLGSCLVASVASAAPEHDPVPKQSWSFDGLLGHYDLASAQRGFQVYEQVCSSCHGMRYVHFGDLTGLGLSRKDVMAIAASHKVPGEPGPDGKPVLRPATLDDPLPTPHVAPGAVVPPDQSDLAMVYPGGPDRIFALLTAYGDVPKGAHAPPGTFWNRYAASRAIAMPPPLRDDAVTYSDGTKATLEQEARDVTTFLAWASDPHLDDRHRTGVRAGLYLLFLAVLLVILKRRIWSNAHRNR